MAAGPHVEFGTRRWSRLGTRASNFLRTKMGRDGTDGGWVRKGEVMISRIRDLKERE